MPYYENVFIARQDVSAATAATLAEKYAELVKEHGGQVTKTEQWGLRSLAYRIKKNRKGHYVLMNIDAPHAAVAELERQMKYEEDIIRFLTVKVEALEEEPSPMMQSRDRGERSDRGDRGDRGERGGRRDRDDRGDRGDRSGRRERAEREESKDAKEGEEA